MPAPAIPVLHPFIGYDIPSLIADRARTRADHPFLIWHPFDDSPRSWRYQDFAAEVEAIAAGMAARGVGIGDRVMVHLDNAPELLLAWFAAARIGAVAVTTNARSSADEIAYFADHAGIVGAITQPSFANVVVQAIGPARWLAVTDHDAGIPAGSGRQPPHADSFKALYSDPGTVPARPADPFAPVSIQYTSGTTSRPKGVVWTHANALWGARINAEHETLQANDRHLCTMPLFHTNALAYSVLATLWTGASCVLLPRWTTSRFWQISLDYKCSWTSMVWFCLAALDSAPAPDHHHYRLWGNALCSPPQDARYGVKTIGWWGMTETITHGIVGHPGFANRPMSMGRPAPEYGIAIVNDDGRPVAPGETGHLKILGTRGVSLFLEYLNNTEVTDASFDDDGWFSTGDRVTLHEDGFISFSGRDKDMLKVGGENVAAAEIEWVIMDMPGVAEVAVVGRRHPMLDEEPVAFLLLKNGAADGPADLPDRALAVCRERLADFKVPAEVRIVSELPRSTLEKVAKARLRALLEDEETNQAQRADMVS